MERRRFKDADVNDQGPAGILYNLVRSQLSESATLAEIQTLVQTSAMTCGIAEDAVVEVMTRFRVKSNPDEPATTTPRLLVDWGELPRVGHQVRPEFSLICPQYTSRPDIEVRVDQDLDHDATDRLRRPQAEDSGLWTFHVPFKMTTGGMDCRPGQYMIDVEVFFREALPEHPRFFRCRLRLNVPDASAATGGILEIDGDGQSMVNLQGHNLKQFSKVVLKGGADSVINLQNTIDGTSDSKSTSGPLDKPATTFEYDLKIDTEKQNRLPKVSEVYTQRVRLDSAGFFFGDGRRTLLFTRPRLTFGRSRDNDVVIRFFPPSEENDNHSRNISRTHFLLEVTPDGIEFIDQSGKGMEVDIDAVHARTVVPVGRGSIHVPIDLGCTGAVPEQFRLDMVTFTPDRNASQEDLEFWDELYCELVGGRLSRLARAGLGLGLDSLRFDRIQNLPGEEAYVLLLRESFIGGAPNRAGVLLKESGPASQARILHMDRSFWLQPLQNAGTITLEGTQLQPGTLVPLVPGMELHFDGEAVRFDRAAQLYLD